MVFEGFQKHLQGIWDHINSNFSKAVFHNFIWSILQYLDPFVNLQCTEHWYRGISGTQSNSQDGHFCKNNSQKNCFCKKLKELFLLPLVSQEAPS